MLARDDVQAVSMCAPPFTHLEIATAALRAGKHVLCEKPVTPTLCYTRRKRCETIHC